MEEFFNQVLHGNLTPSQIIDSLAWVLVAMSLAGNIYVNRKQVIGQWLWAIANVGWIAFNVYKGIVPQAFLFSVYLGICVWGIIKWTKEAKEAKP